MEAVDGEDVFRVSDRFQPDVDVVAEQKAIAHRRHVPRHAVVIGRDPLGSQQRSLDRPEDFFAGGVELLHTAA